MAILLLLLASNQMVVQLQGGGQSNSNIVYAVLFTAMLQFFFAFLSTKQNKSFLWIMLLPIMYILAIFFIKPYKINIEHYLGYLAALFMFAWVMLLKWDSKKIVEFLTIYGLFLISTGIFERVVFGHLRIGILSLTGPTAYVVVLAVIWTIWAINAYLSKIYSAKIILAGAFLAFIAIILSGTRMGLLGIFIGLGLCALSAIFIKKKNMNIIKIAVYLFGIIAALLLLSVISWNLIPDSLIIKQTFSSLLSGNLDESNRGRAFAWIFAVDIFEQNKLLGIGAGNFHEKIKLFLNSVDINSGKFKALIHAHNIYLIVLSEHGIIGFFMLGAFVFLCLLKFFLYFLKNRQSPEFYGIFSGFIVMAILGLIDAIPMYLPTSCLAAWLLGIAASFSKKELFYS
jgi:O-antigen ligase